MRRTYFISRLSSTEILIKELSLICYFESFCIYQGAFEFRMPPKIIKRFESIHAHHIKMFRKSEKSIDILIMLNYNRSCD